MLRLSRIEIENFAVFDLTVLEPSTDPERPLTVIRAENGSGKTTFLRALLWGMYGEKGLPGERTGSYSVHPAWWEPCPEGVETRVAIEFDTDGSTRHQEDASDATTLYRLERIVRTIGRPAGRDDEPDFRRVDERACLMKWVVGSGWVDHRAGVDAVIEQLLPWELRDFFVMDADEATDFAGGAQNRALRRDLVERKTTDAVRSLLGIEVFEATTERLRKLASRLGREATKAIGSRDLDELQKQQDDLEQRRRAAQEELQQVRDRRAGLQSELEACREALTGQLMLFGAFETLASARQAAERRRDELRKNRGPLLDRFAGELERPTLLAALMRNPLRVIAAELGTAQPGARRAVPRRHVAFVERLLEDGECVCGQDLAGDEARREAVNARLARSVENEAETHFRELREAVDSLLRQVEQSSWVRDQAALSSEIEVVGRDLDAAEAEVRDVNRKILEIDRDKVSALREKESALVAQVSLVDRAVGRLEQELVEIGGLLDPVRKKIVDRQRHELAAADSRAAEDVADLAASILGQSYEAIQERQIHELSERMDELFAEMAANASEEDFVAAENVQASVRMVARVGIRPVEGASGRFEIFALNGRGRSMPPTEINGASRRVLALSFILALCAESRTHAPLIADSLLNSMSGTVRLNTLAVTVRNSDQPILLLTGSDLAASAEVECVRDFGGAVYTLTGQWDALEAGRGGDVKNWTVPKKVALLCCCGPRQYCRVCERVGQAGSPGWSERPDHSH